jgi:hypothetical protein
MLCTLHMLCKRRFLKELIAIVLECSTIDSFGALMPFPNSLHIDQNFNSSPLARYQLVNIDVSFQISYLLSPPRFDGKRELKQLRAPVTKK